MLRPLERRLGLLLVALVVGCNSWEVGQRAGDDPTTTSSTTASSGGGGTTSNAGGQAETGGGGTTSVGGMGGEGGGGSGGGGAPSLYDCDPPSGTLDSIAAQVVVGSGLTLPVSLEVAPGDLDRLFVVEKGGRIMVIENGVLLPTPFLDISPFMYTASEAGLLGLAFHPDYQQNRRFFVYYVRFTQDGVHLVEFRRSATDPNLAEPIQVHDDPLMELQFGVSHVAGALKFGPDGYLYLASGDRGDIPQVAQQTTSPLGKILRLDMSVLPYGIPPGNVSGGAPEVYHVGLRNPWRMSFDACTGDIWIGDVGAEDHEEISMVAASDGPQNFGWPIFEGTACYPPGTLGCQTVGLVAPIIDHNHGFPDYMFCIIGGFVYRGSAIPALRGMYVYGATAGLHGLRHDGNGNVTEWKNFSQDVTLGLPVSFGQDHLGELYIVDHLPQGRILKIVPAP